MLLKGKNVIVFPTGVSAATKEDYFSVFIPYLKKHNIVSAVLLCPETNPIAIRHATVLTEQASLFPVLVKNVFIGNEDTLPVLKLVFSSIIKHAPDTIHIVTSGGTGKMVGLAVLIGNLADKFGIEPQYLWAAKENSKFVVCTQPKIIVKEAEKYTIEKTENEDILITYPKQQN